jgi:hypothetical protein
MSLSRPPRLLWHRSRSSPSRWKALCKRGSLASRRSSSRHQKCGSEYRWQQLALEFCTTFDPTSNPTVLRCHGSALSWRESSVTAQHIDQPAHAERHVRLRPEKQTHICLSDRMWIGPGQPSVDNSCSTTNTMWTKHQHMDLMTGASAGPAEWSQQRRSKMLDAI